MSARSKYMAHEIAGVRTRALSASVHILSTRGADELSLRAIAAQAGIGLASIYHYFDSKDELLLSLAHMGFDELRRDMAKAGTQRDGSSPMSAASRAFWAFALKDQALFCLMFSERLLARDQSLRDAEGSIHALYEAAVQADDRIPAPHRANAAAALWAFARGVAAMMASEPTGKLAPDVVERVFGGIRYLIDRQD